jgi:hypothetical protein
MRISARRVAIDVLKTLLFALALLYLADYFRWSLFTEAGGATRVSHRASQAGAVRGAGPASQSRPVTPAVACRNAYPRAIVGGGSFDPLSATPLSSR